MNRAWAAAAAFIVLTPSASFAKPSGLFAAPEMTGVMTFNLRVAVDAGDRAWAVRAPLAAAAIAQFRPLFVGTQEGLHAQVENLKARLPGYDYVGVGRRGETQDEYSALFYDTRRAALVDHGDLWLSDTPQRPGSFIANAGTPRMATWGRFKLASGDEVFVFNTHLALEPEIGARQAQILVAQIGQIAPKTAEVVVTGDFNAAEGSPAWTILVEAGFIDGRRLAARTAGPAFSFHGWDGAAARREAKLIDFILLRPGAHVPRTPLLYDILTPSKGAVQASDHFPVVLTSLGAARLKVGPLRLDTRRIAANQPLTAAVTARNLGARGAAAVVVKVDGKPAQTQWLALDPGQDGQAVFTLRLGEPGLREVAAGDAPVTVTVDPVAAKVDVAAVEAPSYILAGQAATVTAALTNLGSAPAKAALDLIADGEVVEQRPVALPAGGEREEAFALRLDPPGLHTVTLDGRTAQIAVLAPLEAAWRFHRGDDADWRRPGLDDSGWEPAPLPAPWEKHAGYVDDQVFGWCRARVVVPAAWRGRPVRFVLGKIDDVDESFVNGVKVGQTGRLPTDPGGFESQWNVVRAYDVAPEHLVYGGENLIAIRVYDDTGGGGLHAGPIGIMPVGPALDDQR